MLRACHHHVGKLFFCGRTRSVGKSAPCRRRRWQTMTRYLSCVKRFQKFLDVFWHFWFSVSPSHTRPKQRDEFSASSNDFSWKMRWVGRDGSVCECGYQENHQSRYRMNSTLKAPRKHAGSAYISDRMDKVQNNVRSLLRNFLIFRLCRKRF